MLITRKSQVSGKDNTMDINVTKEQIDNWQNGMLIQLAMPNISADEREFLIIGITPQEWEKLFG